MNANVQDAAADDQQAFDHAKITDVIFDDRGFPSIIVFTTNRGDSFNHPVRANNGITQHVLRDTLIR